MKKELRIKKSYEFEQVIHTGTKQTNRSFVVYSVPKSLDYARVGIALSKKIGNAVLRNKYKRQLRMMCHELIDFENYPDDIVIVARMGYPNNSYAENKKNLEKLLIKDKMK